MLPVRDEPLGPTRRKDESNFPTVDGPSPQSYLVVAPLRRVEAQNLVRLLAKRLRESSHPDGRWPQLWVISPEAFVLIAFLPRVQMLCLAQHSARISRRIVISHRQGRFKIDLQINIYLYIFPIVL